MCCCEEVDVVNSDFLTKFYCTDFIFPVRYSLSQFYTVNCIDSDAHGTNDTICFIWLKLNFMRLTRLSVFGFVCFSNVMTAISISRHPPIVCMCFHIRNDFGFNVEISLILYV